MRDRFVVVIAPGRFDRPDAAVQTAREDAAAFADVMLGTEAAGARFDVPQWNASQGKGRAGESYAAASSRFTVVRAGSEQITNGSGKGRFAQPTFAPWLILRDEASGFLLIVIACHLRAHLWPGSKHYLPGNIRTWWQGVRGVKRLRRRLHRAYPRAAMLVGGDPNAVHRDWFTRAIAKTFPRARIAWGGPFSSSLLWGVSVLDVTTLDPGRASDHPWVRVVCKYRAHMLSRRNPKEHR